MGTPTISFKNTAYRGSEGDRVTVQLLVSGVEDMTTPLQNALNNCKIGTLVSSFFAHNAASPGQDVDRTFDISWGELQNGEIIGTAEARLHKDDEKEDIEGVLLYIRNSSKKIKTEPPAYALLLIEDKVDVSAPFFAKAEEDSSKPPQERSHYAFEDYVVTINRERFRAKSPPGWSRILSGETSSISRQSYKSFCPPFTDVFLHEGILYGISLYQTKFTNGQLELCEDRCLVSSLKEGYDNAIYWEKISKQALTEAALAAKYHEWGEFGNLFGGDRNELRKLPLSLSEQLASRNVMSANKSKTTVNQNED